MGYKAGSLVVDILANDQVSNTLDKIGNKIGAFGTKSNRLAKNGGGFGFLKIAKWTAVFAVARRFGRTLSTIVQSGADYTETLNLWETAMGSNLNVATEFVNKMNEAYGISEKTLMNAQAIFKNMLGSLGQISDTMAYSLSEGITQMALDYASLYNQTFEQAFTKFQAALAGQVRPIRSVAGYDITENTLFQLYQSLGGTKTMRQLTRTEKQLLSILAIFNQMTASGAVGDLDKTMESFANQSRVMAEAWQRVLTYSGTLLTHLIEQSGLMIKVNAILIFIGDTLKAVAESMGAIKSFGGNIWEETTNGAMGANEAIDELQGKLLDFDKFRAMSGQEENALGLDEKLLQALSGYDTILANANMEARDLADSLKVMSGLFDEDGVFNPERWEEIVGKIKLVGATILIVFSGAMTYKAINGFLGLMKNIKGIIANLPSILSALTSPLGIILTIIGVLYTTNEKFRELINSLIYLLGNLLNQILEPIIGTVGGLIKILNVIGDITTGVIYMAMFTLVPVLYIIEAIIKSISTLLEVLNALLRWDWGSLGNKLNNLWSNWATDDFTKVFYKDSSVSTYANGGLPDKGTMFIAGEAGAEIVYNTPSGQSGVVNLQQIQSAMYGALVQYGKTQGTNGQPIEVYLDGEKVYQNTTAHAKRRGNVWGRA